jgi:hypothetical protein
MTDRYAIRTELKDGTLLEASAYLARKDIALRVACKLAKSTQADDVVRIWVDDTKTGLGVKACEVKQ